MSVKTRFGGRTAVARGMATAAVAVALVACSAEPPSESQAQGEDPLHSGSAKALDDTCGFTPPPPDGPLPPPGQTCSPINAGETFAAFNSTAEEWQLPFMGCHISAPWYPYAGALEVTFPYYKSHEKITVCPKTPAVDAWVAARVSGGDCTAHESTTVCDQSLPVVQPGSVYVIWDVYVNLPGCKGGCPAPIVW